jgi:heme/copper-type cytochrome/quinol oxidase subunit 2
MKLLEISQFASISIAIVAIVTLIFTCWKFREDQKKEVEEVVEVRNMNEEIVMSPRVILKFRSI